MIDQIKKNRLISYIQDLQLSGAEEILLAPARYFDGYEEDHCTICANRKPVSTSSFRMRLADISARPEVSAVLIRFYEYDDALEDASCWIGSDSVYVITSADIAAVMEWFEDFEPSDVWAARHPEQFANLPKVPEGSRLLAGWWD
jgi:hypothetical protein